MRTEFSRAVRRAAWDRCSGICEAGSCFQILVKGRFTYDHIIPDFDGGKPTLDNCQVICRECDRAKTAADQTAIARTRRLADREIGIATAPRARIRSAGFRQAAPQRSASRPLAKSLPPRVGGLS